jgi:hypothetical protein
MVGTGGGECYREGMAEAAVKTWLRGYRAAALRVEQARAQETPEPERAIAEALSALNLLHDLGTWPGPRDPVEEDGVARVRARWAKVQRRAKETRR